jgi:hypothetical protein
MQKQLILQRTKGLKIGLLEYRSHEVTMLSDAEIKDLIDEEKQLPQNFKLQIKLKQRIGTRFKVCDDVFVQSNRGRKFLIKIRVNIINNSDFSIVLMYVDDIGMRYILRRYNGSHRHKNKIENTIINGFHIHQGTERYQIFGDRIEGYAEPTGKYASWGDALLLMLTECNFKSINSSIMSSIALEVMAKST